ncbi:MAG: hypothetical protein ACI4JY_08950 [Oscillospiraceae bacterium]
MIPLIAVINAIAVIFGGFALCTSDYYRTRDEDDAPTITRE